MSCPTPKKRRFRSWAGASLALARMDNQRSDKRPVRAYKCPGCGGWHLTSQPTRGS